MIGNNTITLNSASMNEALAEYLNKRFSVPGKVIEVISVEGPSNSYAPNPQVKVTFNILEGPTKSSEYFAPLRAAVSKLQKEDPNYKLREAETLEQVKAFCADKPLAESYEPQPRK